VTRIEVAADGVIHIINNGRYVPKVWVPPVLGPAIIEAETQKQFGEFPNRNPAAKRVSAPADLSSALLAAEHQNQGRRPRPRRCQPTSGH
jgi:hypothetical protein